MQQQALPAAVRPAAALRHRSTARRSAAVRRVWAAPRRRLPRRRLPRRRLPRLLLLEARELLTKHVMRDSADVLLGRLNKDISFALRRCTSANSTQPLTPPSARSSAEDEKLAKPSRAPFPRPTRPGVLLCIDFLAALCQSLATARLTASTASRSVPPVVTSVEAQLVQAASARRVLERRQRSASVSTPC